MEANCLFWKKEILTKPMFRDKTIIDTNREKLEGTVLCYSVTQAVLTGGFIWTCDGRI